MGPKWAEANGADQIQPRQIQCSGVWVQTGKVRSAFRRCDVWAGPGLACPIAQMAKAYKAYDDDGDARRMDSHMRKNSKERYGGAVGIRNVRNEGIKSFVKRYVSEE
ncbi:unnamed protein product [Dovyalis caffra]|uniref:Uncharacterized protein n=1 Tax=Dovyalis caffra TaxID=77055 RepID=A0AAV1SQW9_9ROSI|nr:unnamed protein product [Dovyalis caffra]